MNNTNFKMNHLKELRKKKHITQTKLSTEIEVSQELISHFEIGQSKPNIDNLIKLADYFNCSTDYLLNRTDNPTIITNLNTTDANLQRIVNLYHSLTPAHQKTLLDYIEFLANTN